MSLPGKFAYAVIHLPSITGVWRVCFKSSARVMGIQSLLIHSLSSKSSKSSG